MMEQGDPLLSIRVETITHAEYMEGYKVATRREPRIPMGLYTLFLFIVFFLGYWLSQRDLPAVGILVAICVLFWISYRFLRSRNFREATKRLKAALPAQLTLMENGMFGQTCDSETFRTWQHYEGFVETKSVFVLMPVHHSYAIIPKRAVDPEAFGKMQALLSGKLKKI